MSVTSGGDALEGCPVADDAVLRLLELAGNSMVHSRRHRPGGTFTVRAEVCGHYVRVEVRDEGGPWNKHRSADGYQHGLAIVRHIAADSGTAAIKATISTDLSRASARTLATTRRSARWSLRPVWARGDRQRSAETQLTTEVA